MARRQVPRGVGANLGLHGIATRIRHRDVPNHRRRRLLAAADAGRRDDAHVLAEQSGQPRQQVSGTRHLAGQAVAHTHRQRRRRRVAFLHDVEVVVEARDLEHLGLREAHFLGQRREVCRRQLAEAVLNLVQVLDQQVPLARLLAEQLLHIVQRTGFDAPALRRLALA